MGESGLAILDITQPSNCVRLGGFNIKYTEGIAVAGDYAYVVGNGLTIINISNPTNCVMAEIGRAHV